MKSDQTVRHERTSYEIPIGMLCQWLKTLKEKTNCSDIEAAMEMVHFVQLTPSEKEIVSTIKTLYIAEMNGDLNPPPSLREIYENIEEYTQA